MFGRRRFCVSRSPAPAPAALQANKSFVPLGATSSPPMLAAAAPAASSRTPPRSTTALRRDAGPPTLPEAIGVWPLADGSGESKAGPAAVLHAVVGVGTGTEFFPSSTLQIPEWPALADPSAAGGLSISFRLQLNRAGAGKGNLLIRTDQVWGIEWYVLQADTVSGTVRHYFCVTVTPMAPSGRLSPRRVTPLFVVSPSNGRVAPDGVLDHWNALTGGAGRC